ncbi:MAG: glycosyltransferase family 2 protein [Planctomycetes bacterium]|nr:glycosyltransferase family 2 protein [Planctomycetota bacterium]
MPITSCDQYELLSIVSPCYNEQEVIEIFYTELKRVLAAIDIKHEIILVDDGSSDSTLDILNRIAEKDTLVKVYSFSRNFGHQITLTAGLEAARGDAVIMLDSDLQHPVSLIPEMITKWKEGYEIVSAVRKSTEGASVYKNFTSRLFYRLINFLSDIKIPNGAADFCLLSRKAYMALRDMPEKHRFLRGMISWVGMKRAFLPYIAQPRRAGCSKYSLLKMVALAMEAVTSFSAFPLKLATRTGLLISMAGFLYLAWILLRYFLIGDLVSGWGSVICVLLILGGTQLIFIGLIGQYLSRIFEEVKHRPLYVLKQRPAEVQSGDRGTVQQK